MRRLPFALAAALAACSFNPTGSGGPVDAAVVDGPVDAPDAGIDACVPAPGGERCNGVDDDCDGDVDEDFPTLGDACDGADLDQCDDDVVVCAGDGTGPTCGGANPDDDLERCNAGDDDCDGATDEGFVGLGTACDGADVDQCPEGTVACTPDGTATACSDATGDSVEVCNGGDDDCDGTPDDGFMLGVTCDGPDTDQCPEGQVVCDGGGGTTCSDATGNNLEACDALDNDCDGSTDEGFDLTSDVANCGQCGRTCVNSHGTTTCAASTCAPTCAAGARDCDGDPVDGCELFDTNPLCTGALTDLGFVNGDSASTPISRTGSGEAHFTIAVRETVSGGGGDLRAVVTLTSATGTNYDLDVRCSSCGATAVSSNSATGVDTVTVERNDAMGLSTYDLIISVRWTAMTACGDWTLTVAGNLGTAPQLVCP